MRDSIDERPSKLATAWSCLLVIVVLAFAFVNLFWPGWPLEQNRSLRLRWHLVAKDLIEKGMQVNADQLEGEFGWVPDNGEKEGDDVLSIANDAIGRYATEEIKPRQPLTRKMFSKRALIEPSAWAMVVPVEIKPGDAEGLRLGARLGFVKDNVMLPSKHSDNKPSVPFLLRAIERSSSAGD